jgi:hypothetical protein
MSQHVIVVGEDQAGYAAAITAGLTRDRLIAVRTPNGKTVLLNARAVSRLVAQLRELQAEALQGVIWT